jgi:uncharacterized protein YgbK (DUF1537 family)
MRIGTPRKGFELDLQVFARWQEQVITALRALKLSGITMATVTIDFGSIAAQGQVTSAQTVTGARAGAAVVVSSVAAPTSGVVLDGYVSDDDEVTVRASNITASPVDPASASYVIACIAPET